MTQDGGSEDEVQRLRARLAELEGAGGSTGKEEPKLPWRKVSPAFPKGALAIGVGLLALVLMVVVGIARLGTTSATDQATKIPQPVDVVGAPTSDSSLASDTPPLVGRTIVVAMDISASGGPFPTITGTTNLLDGTQLYVDLLKPRAADADQRLAAGLSACIPDCTPWARPVTVKGGHFTTAPFATETNEASGSRGIKPGIYQIMIGTLGGQPEYIGQMGGFLRGPYVENIGTANAPLLQVKYFAQVEVTAAGDGGADTAGPTNTPATATLAQRSPKVSAYEARVSPLWRLAGATDAASMCGLRSDAWEETIATGIEVAIANEPLRAEMSQAELNVTDADGTRVEFSTRDKLYGWATGGACTELRSSGMLEKLDRFESQLTGNYH